MLFVQNASYLTSQYGDTLVSVRNYRTRDWDQGPGPGTGIRDLDQGPRSGTWIRDRDLGLGSGTGIRDQGLGQDCEFVHLHSGVHKVDALLGLDAPSDPRRKATTGIGFFTP